MTNTGLEVITVGISVIVSTKGGMSFTKYHKWWSKEDYSFPKSGTEVPSGCS